VVGAGEKELPHPVPVDTLARPLQSPELSHSLIDLPQLNGSGLTSERVAAPCGEDRN
jgi:hypothetical protein